MERTHAYYRITEAARCCLNCGHFECHYTTEDGRRFYPAAAGCCTYSRLRLRGVTDFCRNYIPRVRTTRDAASIEEILELIESRVGKADNQ